jgi:hypothetical protein
MMKITGYSAADVGLPPEQVRFIDLAEVTVTASPAEVRRFAAFLSSAADEMDRLGSKYSHEHLADRQNWLRRRSTRNRLQLGIGELTPMVRIPSNWSFDTDAHVLPCASRTRLVCAGQLGRYMA